MNKEDNLENNRERLWVFFLVLALMIALWAFSGWWINNYFESDATKRGTFGDMFGAINALFSGAAFAGVIYTILLQRKELGLQRNELKLTREELTRAAEAQEKTAKLSAYTALLASYTQTAQYIHEVMDKRPSTELAEQYKIQINERDYCASKVAELVGEKLDKRA